MRIQRLLKDYFKDEDCLEYGELNVYHTYNFGENNIMTVRLTDLTLTISIREELFVVPYKDMYDAILIVDSFYNGDDIFQRYTLDISTIETTYSINSEELKDIESLYIILKEIIFREKY